MGGIYRGFWKTNQTNAIGKEIDSRAISKSAGCFKASCFQLGKHKNLPDLELIIAISKLFSVSLDDLILGGSTMNNLTEKLIKDGSETRRAKMNLISIAIGGIFLCFGISCIFLKAVSVEYIDTQGILHENFFLLPVGFLCLFCGFITFLTIGIRNIFCRIKKKFCS